MAKPHLIYKLMYLFVMNITMQNIAKKIYSPRGADVQFLLNIPTVRILPA